MSLVPYGCVLEYARKYDEGWKNILKNVLLFLQTMYPQHFLRFRSRQTKLYLTNSQHPRCALASLPDENVYECMKYMSFKDLSSCCLVCKAWNKLAINEGLWKQLLFCDFRISIQNLKVPMKTIINFKDVESLSERNSTVSSKVAYKLMATTFLQIANGKAQNFGNIPTTIPVSFLNLHL